MSAAENEEEGGRGWAWPRHGGRCFRASHLSYARARKTPQMAPRARKLMATKTTVDAEAESTLRADKDRPLQGTTSMWLPEQEGFVPFRPVPDMDLSTQLRERDLTPASSWHSVQSSQSLHPSSPRINRKEEIKV